MRLLLLSLAAIPLMASTYNLQGLMDHALQNDAALKAEREALQQLTYEKESLKAWENPELSLSYMRTKPDAMDNQNEYGLALLQPIEKPSLRSAKLRVNDARIVQSKALMLQKERDIRGDVRLRAYQYSVASMMAESAEQSLRLAREFHQKGEQRFGQGAISKADLLKLQIEEEKIAQEAEAARIKRDSARNALALASRLDDTSDLEPISLPEPKGIDSVPDLDTLPMSGYFKASEEEFRAQKEVASESIIPGFKAGIGYQKLFDQHSIGATLSMPIPLLNRNEPQIKSAESRLNETRLRQSAYRYALLQQSQQLRLSLSSLATLAKSQDALLERSATMVRLAQRSYEEGYGTLLELIDARRTHVAHQRDRLNTLETYYNALGEFQKIFPPVEEKQ